MALNASCAMRTLRLLATRNPRATAWRWLWPPAQVRATIGFSTAWLSKSNLMWQYALKIILSAALLVAVAEIAKRSSFWAAALASLPLTSLLAFVWLYIESGDIQRVSALSQGIFWLVLPSLVLFIALPLLLRSGFGFWLSLAMSCLATAVAYFGMVRLLRAFSVHI